MVAQICNVINHQIVDLLLELYIFSLKGCVNKDNQINFLIYKFTFQRFAKKMWVQKFGHYLMFLVVLAFQMKVCHFGMFK